MISGLFLVNEGLRYLKEAGLLGGGTKQPGAGDNPPATSPSEAALVPEPVSLYDTSTGEDFEEFLKMMQQGKRPFRRPGITVRQEYELWLGAKARAKSAPANVKPQTA